MKTKRIVAYILLVMTLLFCITACSGGNGISKSKAIEIAKTEIRTRVSDPMFVNFPSNSEMDVSKNGNEWRVDGWYTYLSEKNTFTIKFSLINENEYRIESCFID